MNRVKKYKYDKNTDTYYGEQLPEIIKTPSNEDKAVLQAVRSNIPDKNTRNYILQLLDEYNTDYGFYEKPIIIGNGAIYWKENPKRDSYERDINQMAARTSELYRLAGRPRIKKTPSLSAKILGLIGLDGGMASDRAHMQPLNNTMYNIDDFDNFLAELSHSYNNRQIGFFNQGIPRSGHYGYDAYESPYSLEHTTHSYTQPLLETYIKSANIPEYKYINPKYINETIKNKVKEDRKQILKFVNGGFIKINNSNRNNMKIIKKYNQRNNINRILFNNKTN